MPGNICILMMTVILLDARAGRGPPSCSAQSRTAKQLVLMSSLLSASAVAAVAVAGDEDERQRNTYHKASSVVIGDRQLHQLQLEASPAPSS